MSTHTRDELTARDRAAFLLTLVCAYRRKRAVDGMNGRMWDGSVHLSAEREIDALEAQWLTIREPTSAGPRDHHDEFWKHPWAVRLSRIVCNDTLTAAPSWHEEARGLVMDIEVQGDGDLLALTRDRAIEAENRLAGLLAVAMDIAASAEPCVICATVPHRSDCLLVAAIAKAEGRTKGQAA